MLDFVKRGICDNWGIMLLKHLGKKNNMSAKQSDDDTEIKL